MFFTALLSLGGAALGWALSGGATFGLALGLLAGRVLGTALLGGATREGPRIEDRSVHTDELGAPLAVLFGTDVLGGHTMWVRNGELQEVVDKDTVGGFLGIGGTTVKEFRYKLNALVVFADTRHTGPVKGILRLWEDNDLVYEVDQAALDAAIAAGEPLPAVQSIAEKGLDIEVWPGSATQAVDPEIDADMRARGLGPAPAFRHMAAIRIRNRDVTRFRRMPDYRAEVVGAGADSFTWQPWPLPAVFEQNEFDNYAGAAAHPAGGDTWVWADNLGSRLAVMDLRRHAAKVQRDYAAEGDVFDPGEGEVAVRPGGNKALAMDDLGRVYAADGSKGIWRLNAETLIAEALAAGPSALSTGQVDMSAAGSDRKWMRVNTFAFPEPTGTLRLLVANRRNDVYVVDADTMTLLATFALQGQGGDDPTQKLTYDIEPVDPESPSLFDFWANGRNSFNGVASLVHWRLARGATWTASEQSVQGGFGGNAALNYVPSEDAVYLGASGGAGRLYDRALALLATASEAGWRSFSAAVRPTGADMWVLAEQSPMALRRLRASDLALLEERFLSAYTANAGWHSVPGTNPPKGFVDPLFRSATVHAENGVARFYLPRLAPQKVDRSWVYRTLAEIAGVPSARIDVSAVTGQIWGYALRRDVTAADAMRELMGLYGEDAVMAGWALKFFPLPTSPAATLAARDLGAGAGRAAEDRAVEERAAAPEVPRQLEIVYPDRTNPLYETNLARSPMVPDVVPAAKATQRRQVPVPLTPDEAAQRVDVLHRRAWIEREPVTLPVTRRYPQLHAGDVIRVPRDEHAAGLTIDVRLTAVTEGVHPALEGVRAAGAYTSTAVGLAGGIPAHVLRDIPRSELVVLDIPMVAKDGRADDAAVVRAAVAPRSAGGLWDGAELLRSSDGGETYNTWQVVTSAALIGFAEAALPDATSHKPDEASTLTVQWLAAPGLASASDADFYGAADAGGNLFAVWNAAGQDWEVIRARDVADLGADRTTLSLLARGRVGTDHLTAGHAAGDPVVRLDASLLLTADGVAVGGALRIAAVTLGLTLTEADVEAVTPAANTLRPWRMQVISASRNASDDLSVDVTYRSRYPDIGLDGVDTTSLADGQDAGVDVLDAPGGAVVATYAFSGTAFSYTAAQQTGDGLTPGDPVTLVFHHLADTGFNPGGGGRGVPLEVTV